MATQHAGRASALPSAALLESAIRRLSRDALAGLCEQLIDRLDAMDPDPDLEANGDELDGNNAEDDFGDHGCNVGPYAAAGCPIADPDAAVDDGPCDEPTQDREPDDFAERFADPEALEAHRRRIQQTRCYPLKRRYRDFRSGMVMSETYAHELFYEPTVPTKRQLLRRKRGVPRRPRG